MTARPLTLRAVVARVTLGRTALYERVRGGEFPAPVKLSETRHVWVASEVDAWIERLVARRDAGSRDATPPPREGHGGGEAGAETHEVRTSLEKSPECVAARYDRLAPIYRAFEGLYALPQPGIPR